MVINMEDVQVSIICNAFNHEAYIRDTMEGFVMQKTTFPFEVLVHDDASTDHTADIIREYEVKYPQIIKPIYETENQYSKQDGSLRRIQYGRVRGKYIALCEGDDYWTDPFKLQKQFDALEAHPEIDICATTAAVEIGGQIVRETAPAQEDTIFTPEEVIEGGGGFVATVSLMYRTRIRKEPLPFFQITSLDYCTQILGSLRGGMLYLADSTCVYRFLNPGSWTVQLASDIERENRFRQKLCRILRCLDADTAGKYHDTITRVIRRHEFDTFKSRNDYRSMCLPEYRDLLREISFFKRAAVRFGCVCPAAVDLAQNIRQRFQ